MLAIGVFLTLVIGLMQAVATQDEGVSIVRTAVEIFGSQRFWLQMILFLAVSISVYMLLWSVFLKGIPRVKGSKKGVSNFSRMRWLGTVGFVVYAGTILYGICRAIRQGVPLGTALGTMSLGLVYGVFLGMYVLLSWLKPSAEKARALETGDYSKVDDERHKLVVMRSAQSTLWLAIGGVLVIGSLVDMVVYRRMPIRSVVEAAVLMMVWQLSYMQWNKRM